MRFVALFLIATLLTTTNVVNSLAYGEVAVASEYSLSMEVAKTDAYKSWKKSNWNEQTSSNSTHVMLTPGADSSQMNFAWYSETGKNQWLKVSTDAKLNGAVNYQPVVKAISQKNWKTTYKACNQVTVTKLMPNTRYYYSYSGESTQIYSFRTTGNGDFQAIVVGDPQIGASGTEGEGTKNDANIPADTYSWSKLLDKAISVAPNASFLMSVGDQINFKAETADTKGIRESEYAGLTYPSTLRSIPFAPAIGNHESKGVDFKYHYNLPNDTSGYGKTNAGSDYYYQYGNCLFIVLNSNSRNMASHKKAMAQAVSSYPTAKWRVVMMHHDIYGSGVLHSNGSAANLRILFAPLMDEYKVDLVLGGHDHSYARSYSMLDGTAINYGAAGAVNPSGTTYLAIGSASGSKFYGLAAEKQYYVAERSNTQKQTFSTLNFTGDSLTVKIYDIDGKAYGNDYTITKTQAKQDVLAELASYSKVKKTIYTKYSYNKLASALKKMKSTLRPTATDSGYSKLVSRNGAANDPLTYYSNANTAYKNPSFGRNLLKQGFSTLLDKTTVTKLRISKTKYKTAYEKMKLAYLSLKKTSLTVKKGKKKLTTKTVVKLKRKKSFKINAITKPKKKKATYSSSAKKYVKVSKSGKVTALRKRKKAVTITVKYENRKKTFKVKVK